MLKALLSASLLGATLLTSTVSHAHQARVVPADEKRCVIAYRCG